MKYIDKTKYIDKAYRKFYSVFEEPIKSNKGRNGHTEEELKQIKATVLDVLFRQMDQNAVMEVKRADDLGKYIYKIEVFYQDKGD